MPEIINNESLFNFLESLDITGNLAIILVTMMVFNSVCFMLNIRMLIKHARMDNRQEMHASHFDVVDGRAERAEEFSMKAVFMAAESKFGKAITDEDICIFIEAQNIVETAIREKDKLPK